jgi:hypothetical protein
MVNSVRSIRFAETTTPAGVGVTERQIHTASGLRTACIQAALGWQPNSISQTIASDSVFGGTGGAAVTDWTSLRVPGTTWNPRLPLPMTPTLTLFAQAVNATPVTMTARFRLRGMGQFGETVEEVTPWLSWTWTTSTHCIIMNASRVFATLDSVEFQSTNIDKAHSAVFIGWHCIIDPTGVEAATVDFTAVAAAWTTGGVTSNIRFLGTYANWGLGTQLMLSPYGPDVPYRTPEILGGSAVMLRSRVTNSGAPAITLLAAAKILPVYQDVLTQPPAAITRVATGLAVGKAAAGWQNTPSKVGFASTDAWTTKITGIDLRGSSSETGGVAGIPDVYSELGDDEILFNINVRSTLGTQRGANPLSSYIPT